MTQRLILALTGTANSEDIIVTSDPVTLTVSGTQTAGQYFDIAYSTDDGANFSDLYQDGSQVRLSSVNSAVTIYGPGVYRVEKEATTNACGLFASSPGNP